MQKPIERDIVVDGQLVHFYHVEPSFPKKSTVVFLHGWGSSSPLWFASTGELVEKGYDLYFFDLPGFGKSQSPLHPFQLQDYADIVSHCFHKLEIANPVLIGHSFGGKVAIRIASKKAIKLTGLILVDSSGLAHTSVATKTKIQIAKIVKPLMDLPFMKGIRSKLLRLLGSDDYLSFPELKETFVNIIREHIETELSQIEDETLIVWGGDDKNEYTPVDDVRIFHRLILHVKTHIITGAGHYCFIDKPIKFQAIILSFLESLYEKN